MEMKQHDWTINHGDNIYMTFVGLYPLNIYTCIYIIQYKKFMIDWIEPSNIRPSTNSRICGSVKYPQHIKTTRWKNTSIIIHRNMDYHHENTTGDNGIQDNQFQNTNNGDVIANNGMQYTLGKCSEPTRFHCRQSGITLWV
jgi:hypothetical protein